MSLSAGDIRKSIEFFLESNNLYETLYAFRNENSHNQN